MNDDIKRQYAVVFDKDGHVRACGRDACKELIRLCQTDADAKSRKGFVFGDAETGVMNIGMIRKYLSDEGII